MKLHRLLLSLLLLSLMLPLLAACGSKTTSEPLTQASTGAGAKHIVVYKSPT